MMRPSTGTPGIRPARGRRGFAAAACALLLTAAAGPAVAQVNVSAQTAASFLVSGDAPTQYAYNGGRATFGWRADLFFDATVTDDILFLSNVRMTQDQELHVDLFTIRFTGIAGAALNAEAGLIDVPFGNIGERRFPRTNPFLSLPIVREHRTSLRASDYELWTFDGRYAAAGNGVRLIDGGLYDAGVKLYGSAGMLDYAAAVIDGSVSSTGSYAPGGLNDNGGFTLAARVALTPAAGLTVGLSAARGPFMSAGTTSYYGSGYGDHDPARHLQEIAGADVEYGYGHLMIYGEGFLNRWEFSDEYGADLRAAGFSAEIRYVPAARISLAARVGGITFSDLPGRLDEDGAYAFPARPWDHDVLSLEGAAGYRITREVLLKAVYRHMNTLDLATDPRDDTAAIQIVASF